MEIVALSRQLPLQSLDPPLQPSGFARVFRRDVPRHRFPDAPIFGQRKGVGDVALATPQIALDEPFHGKGVLDRDMSAISGQEHGATQMIGARSLHYEL
jgi:hypothetical protein